MRRAARSLNNARRACAHERLVRRVRRPHRLRDMHREIGDVSISLDFTTAHTSNGGLTGFSLDTRVGTTGAICSSAAGKERFRLVDRWSRGPVAAGGTGMLSFVLSTRPRTSADPDVSIVIPGPPVGQGGGSVGVDCLDCTFERSICDRTCEQMHRACLRGCPECN